MPPMYLRKTVGVEAVAVEFVKDYVAFGLEFFP